MPTNQINLLMDIVLQFGEFYSDSDSSWWGDFFQTFLSSLLGFGFALWVLYIQLKTEKNKEFAAQRELHEDKISFFALLLRQTIDHSNKQVKSYRQISDEVRSNPYQIHKAIYYASSVRDRLLAMNPHEVFNAYTNVFSNNLNKAEEINKLYKELDFVDLQLKDVKNNFESYVTSTYKRSMEYKILIEELSDYLAESQLNIKTQYPNKYRELPEWIFLDNSLLHFHKELIEKEAPLEKYKTEFLIPLIHTILEFHYEQPFAHKAMIIAKKANVLLNDLKNDSIGAADLFAEVEAKISETLSSIETNSKHILDFKKTSLS